MKKFKHENQVKNQIKLIQEKYPIILRDYQEEIIIEAFDEIITNIKNKENSSILIEAPTGAGKTVIGLMIIKILETFYYPNSSTNWCAMRRELLSQAKEANNKNFKLNNKMEYVSLFSNEIPEGEVLVMDEAHHDSTFSGANVHKMSNAKIVIGLTATPLRGDHVDLYFIKKIHSANTQRLVDQGYLMKYDHFLLSDWNCDLIVESYLANKLNFGQTIFFVKNYEECQNLTRKLKENGIKVEMVHSKLNNKDRELFVKQFKNKELDCLVNINVLTEGFDYDDLRTVYCRPSQRSLTKQMAGRCLRLSELYSHVNIVQSTNTLFKYFNEVKPTNSYKYNNDKRTWETDSLDFSKIDRFIDEQNLNVMVELQKKNGMEQQANLMLDKLKKIQSKNEIYEEHSKVKKELNQMSFSYEKLSFLNRILSDIFQQKLALDYANEPYLKEYDLGYILNNLNKITFENSYKVSKILAQRELTENDWVKVNEKIIRSWEVKEENKPKKALSLDDEIRKIQKILV